MIPKDPMMLLSFLNLKLRDYYSDLDKLCEDLDISKGDVEAKMNTINYVYDKERNQFV